MTETLESLDRRIAAATELETVTRTMKGLAAVNVRHFERAAEALDDYQDVVERGFQVLLRSRRVDPGIETEAGRHIDVLAVMGSNQGLCGPINRRMSGFVEESLAGDIDDDSRVVAVGQRMGVELELAGIEVSGHLDLPGTVPGISRVVRELLVLMDEHSAPAREGRIEVAFPRFQGRHGRYEPVVVRLTPLDPEWLRSIAGREWPTRMLPIHRTSWEELFSSLVGQMLFVRLHRAVAQTMAAVSASRLSAMDGAQRTIDERLVGLRSRHHRLRQSQITEELLDVISGFESLEG